MKPVVFMDSNSNKIVMITRLINTLSYVSSTKLQDFLDLGVYGGRQERESKRGHVFDFVLKHIASVPPSDFY